MSSGSLFAPVPEFRRNLAEKLHALARESVWIGTSSWKYQGWLGQIYTPERYQTRGRFSKKKFDDECLTEYAETFPIVCGDFSFYQFPSDSYWRRLFAGSPSALRFAFKVPEMITVKDYPRHARYGARAGQENPSFLDAGLFQNMFLRPLEPYGERVALMIFEFGTFSKSAFESPTAFVEALDRFLGALPRAMRYSVEMRNPEYLGPEYFGCLRGHGVAHVFNGWSRMPELGTQIRIPGVYTADFTVTRALLRYGRNYEQAVNKFEPYEKIQDENPAARDAMRALIRRARESKQGAFVFVNNRLEGNAPATIDAVVADL